MARLPDDIYTYKAPATVFLRCGLMLKYEQWGEPGSPIFTLDWGKCRNW